MELTEALERAGSFIAIPALMAFFLLLPLYVSQRRDIARLRDWMEREPDHPVADLGSSDARLDRAETELAELLADRGDDPEATLVRPPTVATAAAARVATERPALQRITIEREALEPHPRWRRVANRLTRPWALAAIGLVAVVAGGAAIVGSERILSGGPTGPAETVERSEVTVSVLNATASAGLAGRLQSDIAGLGYGVDAVGAAASGVERTVVMFREGQRPAAVRLAQDLGLAERRVEPIDSPTRRLAGEAGVVVIAGEDRVR